MQSRKKGAESEIYIGVQIPMNVATVLHRCLQPLESITSSFRAEIIVV